MSRSTTVVAFTIILTIPVTITTTPIFTFLCAVPWNMANFSTVVTGLWIAAPGCLGTISFQMSRLATVVAGSWNKQSFYTFCILSRLVIYIKICRWFHSNILCVRMFISSVILIAKTSRMYHHTKLKSKMYYDKSKRLVNPKVLCYISLPFLVGVHVVLSFRLVNTDCDWTNISPFGNS